MTADNARDYRVQLVHYLRKTFNFGDAGITTLDTVAVGMLPAGAQITGVVVNVATVFNAGTTNTLVVGTNTGTDNNIAATGDTNLASAQAFVVTTGLTLALTADTTVYCRYNQTGTAATTGKATIVISYVLNNDK